MTKNRTETLNAIQNFKELFTWDEYSIQKNIKMLVLDIPPSEKELKIEFVAKYQIIEFLYFISEYSHIEIFNSSNKHINSHPYAEKYTLLYKPYTKSLLVTKRNTPLKAVRIQIPTESLLRLIHESGHSVPPQLYAGVTANNKKNVCIPSTLPLPIQISVQQIIDCKFTGLIKKIFMEYKGLETLFTQFSLLNYTIPTISNVTEYEHHAITMAYKIIMQDICSPPSLMELAKKVGITHTKLNKLFKKMYGKTAFELLRHERLECAKRMLKDNKRSIAEIAYECGFSSPSHLSHSFAAQYGMQPKRYQNESMLQNITAKDGKSLYDELKKDLTVLL